MLNKAIIIIIIIIIITPTLHKSHTALMEYQVFLFNTHPWRLRICTVNDGLSIMV